MGNSDDILMVQQRMKFGDDLVVQIKSKDVSSTSSGKIRVLEFTSEGSRPGTYTVFKTLDVPAFINGNGISYATYDIVSQLPDNLISIIPKNDAGKTFYVRYTIFNEHDGGMLQQEIAPINVSLKKPSISNITFSDINGQNHTLSVNAGGYGGFVRGLSSIKIRFKAIFGPHAGIGSLLINTGNGTVNLRSFTREPNDYYNCVLKLGYSQYDNYYDIAQNSVISLCFYDTIGVASIEEYAIPKPIISNFKPKIERLDMHRCKSDSCSVEDPTSNTVSCDISIRLPYHESLSSIKRQYLTNVTLTFIPKDSDDEDDAIVYEMDTGGFDEDRDLHISGFNEGYIIPDDREYVCSVNVIDNYGQQASVLVEIPLPLVIMHINSTGKGVAFGGKCSDDKFQIRENLPLEVFSNSLFRGNLNSLGTLEYNNNIDTPYLTNHVSIINYLTANRPFDVAFGWIMNFATNHQQGTDIGQILFGYTRTSDHAILCVRYGESQDLYSDTEQHVPRSIQWTQWDKIW